MMVAGVLVTCRVLVLAFLMATTAPVTLALAGDSARGAGSTSTFSCPPCRCHAVARGEVVNCDSLNLTRVPDSVPSTAIELSMQFNRIASLTAGMFERFHRLGKLVLAYNEIEAIEDLAFASLSELRVLDLQGNHIIPNDSVLRPSVFAGLHNLRVLRLNKNSGVQSDVNFSSSAFTNLTSLTTLFVDGFRGMKFGPDFSQLHQLENLTISGIHGHCELFRLENDSFTYLPHVKNLDLRKCKLRSLDAEVFRPLRNLQTLDLSHNYFLGFDCVGQAADGLRSTQIHTLKINFIYPRFAVCVVIRPKHLKYFNETKLKEIQLDGNNIVQLEKGALSLLPQTLTTVSAKLNLFTFGGYLLELHHLTNLETINLSNRGKSNVLPSIWNPYDVMSLPPWPPSSGLTSSGSMEPHAEGIGYILSTLQAEELHHHKFILDGVRDDCNCGESSDPKLSHPQGSAQPKVKMIYPVPPKLAEVRMKWNTLYYRLDQLALTENNLSFVDISCNIFSEWIGPLGGVGTVQTLDLSNNFAHKVSEDFFHNFTSLKKLDVHNNMLHGVLASNSSGLIFSSLRALETLDISFNRVKYLHDSLMQGLHSLQTFVCVSNQLTSEGLNVSISPAKNLKLLNFTSNNLQSIPYHLRQSLDLMVKEGKNVSLDISDNPFVCECWNLRFLSWISTTKVKLHRLNRTYCTFPESGIRYPLSMADEAITMLEKACFATKAAQVAIMTVGILVFIIVILGSIAFRLRWKLYYLYYVARNQSSGRDADQELLLQRQRDFLYDAFIAFDLEDRAFVQDELRARLEEQQGLRLCLHYRDLPLGRFSLQSAVEAIHSSRRTVCLLTQHFLESRECRFFFEMARMESLHENRDVVLFVLKDHVVSRALPRDILYFIKTESYVEYPRDQRCLAFFWDNLVKAMRSPVHSSGYQTLR